MAWLAKWKVPAKLPWLNIVCRNVFSDSLSSYFVLHVGVSTVAAEPGCWGGLDPQFSEKKEDLLSARIHRRFLSQQLNAISVAPKLNRQNRTCKPAAILGNLSPRYEIQLSKHGDFE